MFRSGTVVGGSPTVSSGVPSSRACGQKGGCQMGVGVFQPSEMEVVMSEHRSVITGRLWQSIAPLLPDKATDRGVTADRTIQLRTTHTRSAGVSTAAQPTSTGRLAAWRITPCRTRWLESRLADPALQRAGALFLMKSEPGMGRHEKGGLRPPVHTTSEKIRRRG